MDESHSSIDVSIWRGDENGGFQSYRVPSRSDQTVLDVVTWVQRNVDPTLSYRFACRVGMCGSCAMTVNGRPRWTCRTHVKSVFQESKLEIAPLSNMPVIKDLASDMRVFFEKWTRARGSFASNRSRTEAVEEIRPDTPARRFADEAIECINCGVCYAACDTVRWNEDYLGPAALNRAWALMNDVRDTAGRERLEAVSAKGGCHSCHSHQSCQAHCPQTLNPTRSIAGLKGLSLQAYLRGEIKP